MNILFESAQFILTPQDQQLLRTYFYPLHSAPATIIAGTLLAITRRLLHLERCSNPLRIQQVL